MEQSILWEYIATQAARILRFYVIIIGHGTVWILAGSGGANLQGAMEYQLMYLALGVSVLSAIFCYEHMVFIV